MLTIFALCGFCSSCYDLTAKGDTIFALCGFCSSCYDLTAKGDKNSQTCIKRSHFGQKINGLLRQVGS
jgi:hypothetical protein